MSDQLTVLIPCKDEQDNIRDCIDSVRGVADEILVADSGSTDGTLAIVRGLADCRLIEREFVNYSDFKNWAIPQARHPWVLILDADERLTPALAKEIRHVLENPPEHLDGYWIYRRNHFFGRPIRFSGWNTDAVFRLIRRDRCRYLDRRVHEEIDVAADRAGRLRNRMLHYSVRSYDQYFNKYLKYTRWGAMDMWDRGKRTSYRELMFRPFLRFLYLYVVRCGFLDGLAGLQICMLQSFFVSFVKQARLWELQQDQSNLPGANPQPPTEKTRAVPAKPQFARRPAGSAVAPDGPISNMNLLPRRG